MRNEEMVAVDMRWLEGGWREAFRARICGWLPSEWSKSGVQKGVLTECLSTSEVKLTPRGHALTDICPKRTSQETMMAMGMVLATQGFEPEWFSEAGDDGVLWLEKSMMFDEKAAAQFKMYFASALKEERDRAVRGDINTCP